MTKTYGHKMAALTQRLDHQVKDVDIKGGNGIGNN